MKPKYFLLISVFSFITSLYGQNTLKLTFTGIDNADHVQLNSVKVMNRTQGGDTVLYYPDTVLVLDYQVGISESKFSTNGFQLMQNYPNPVIGQTNISFYIPERDKVSLIATNMLGRTLIKAERTLDKGYHSYRFIPGNGSLLIFTVQWKERSSSINILRTNAVSNNTTVLEYIGVEDSYPQPKSTRDIQSFLFHLGDTLLYIGNHDTLQSGMLDAPQTNETYTFQFATNIPCPGTPTIEYAGQIYNTIQIFSQCWLKENLNIGTLIPGTESMTDNDTIEKYCYYNEPDSCTKYGGLYEWDEIMQYTTQLGTQGICPQGWHIPTDEEWKVLEGTVDLYISIGHQVWEETGYRGSDAGKNLKTINGWHEGGNGSDLFGFSGLPGGFRYDSNTFSSIGGGGSWWTSSLHDNSSAYTRYLYYGSDQAYRGFVFGFAKSVRCIKDD